MEIAVFWLVVPFAVLPGLAAMAVLLWGAVGTAPQTPCADRDAGVPTTAHTRRRRSRSAS